MTEGYFDRYEAGYRDLIAALTAEFGTAFRVYNTGGGCMALEATVENGYLLVTDAEDTLSPMSERIEAQASGVCYGYAVGIYRTTDDSDENVAYVSEPNAVTSADVIALTHAAFKAAGIRVVCAIAYHQDGTEYDRCLTWETGQTLANEGYRVLAVANDGCKSMSDMQAMFDYELKIALDCFGEGHRK